MTNVMDMRWRFVLMGALAGLVLWGLSELPDNGGNGRALVFSVIVASVGFFSTFLLMIGRARARHCLRSAALIGLVVFLAATFLGQRFSQQYMIFDEIGHFMALWVAMLVPL